MTPQEESELLAQIGKLSEKLARHEYILTQVAKTQNVVGQIVAAFMKDTKAKIAEIDANMTDLRSVDLSDELADHVSLLINTPFTSG
jgi:uncharacterized coiled-coil DUF342 family protein